MLAIDANDNYSHLNQSPIPKESAVFDFDVADESAAATLYASAHAAGVPIARAPQPPIDVVTSRDLLRGRRELLIRHGDTWYRLRHTRSDKLILTK